MSLISSLRRRVEHSATIATLLAAVIGGYLALCNKTTRWQASGLEELRETLTNGPVLLVMWHERSMMGPVHWPVRAGQLSSLYASSAIGRVSGAMQRLFGLQPMEMSDTQGNLAASRMILKRARAGVSIGMTGDGPLGPALQVKDAPLGWAQKTAMPVYAYAFATRRHRRLKSWDRMMMPLPFTTGAIVFARMPDVGQQGRSTDDQRAGMAAFLNAAMQKADQLAGLS